MELNRQIQESSPSVFDCLSDIGKQMYFPKGILSQSNEAKEKASRFNATIGIATENGEAMHLDTINRFFNGLHPNEVYPYAPPTGLQRLRELWRQKLIRTNPSLEGKDFSMPIVTSALTHGLCMTGSLLVDKDDVLVVPDKFWGVYSLNFCTRRGGKIKTFPMFNDQRGFNILAFEETLRSEAATREKLIVILSFPNNPTGYTPSVAESQKIFEIIRNQAERGTKIVTISDDAYFGLFYEDSIKESLFGELCNLHENVLAIKLDGATKESFAWGFRTGFITFGNRTANTDQLFEALEMKVKGFIRSTISSCSHASQSIIAKVFSNPEYYENIEEKFQILKKRAQRLKKVLSQEKFKPDWEYYPFNSGYFMCLKLHKVDAEELRVHLLDKYGVGTIAMGETDLRIAFSCVEENQIEELIDLIHQGATDLS